MPTDTEHAVARRLTTLRVTIVDHVTDQLAATLSPTDLDPRSEHRLALHHQRLLISTERFHDLVQLAATIDWGLVAFEYDWTTRVLQPLGITGEHLMALIDTYFAAARRLALWSDEERKALAHLADLFRAEVSPVSPHTNAECRMQNAE